MLRNQLRRTLDRRHRRRGSMLIVALGVLMLLSVLAVTFVGLMKLELLASKNYVDGVKARLIAEGGLEEAIAELKARGGLDGVTSIDMDWVYANGNYWLPLEESSAIRIKTDPKYNANARCSFTGTLGASYPNGKDRYKIQVIDAQAQFNLNNSFRHEAIYIRELEALGVAISQLNPRAKAAGVNPIKDARYPKDNPIYFGAEAVLRFRDSLDGKTFTSKYQLTEIMPDDLHYKLLRDYVTTKSWIDMGAVSADTFGSADPTNRDSSNPDLPRSKGFAFSDVSRPQPAPNSNQKPVRRSPINVNLASQEVIAANLCGVAGRAVFMYFGGHSGKPVGLQMIDAGNQQYAYTQHKEIQEETDYASYPVVVYFPPLGYQYGGAPAPSAPAKYANDQPAIGGALQIAQMICNRRRQPTGTASSGAQGPFKCYADWERWVDENITDSFLQSFRDPTSGQLAFPQPDTAPMFSAIDQSALVSPAVSDVRSTPRFRPWFYDCVRSVIKAAFNPNARASSLNPDSVVNLPVDRGNLLFPGDPLHPEAVSVNNAGALWNTDVCEWCFGSKGIFEVISLGEVMGADAVADETAGKPTNPFAQAKILTVVQIFDQVVHTSQRDFERNGQPAGATAGMPSGWGEDLGQPPAGFRYGIVSWPFAKQLWDPRLGTSSVDHLPAMQQGGLDIASVPNSLVYHAHDCQGYLELSKRIESKARGSQIYVTNFDGKNALPLFELLFQDAKLRNTQLLNRSEFSDAFVADVANNKYQYPSGPGVPVTGDPLSSFAMPHPFFCPAAASGVSSMLGYTPHAIGEANGNNTILFQQLLLPDGFHTNELRNLPLWFRASNRASVQGKGGPDWPGNSAGPEGSQQGDSGNPKSTDNTTNPGNCLATATGGVEFWYKPEFDWFVRQKNWPSNGGDPVEGFAPGATQIPSEGTSGTVDPRLCGFISTSHTTYNDAVTAASWSKVQPAGTRRPTRGTQMYITRNSSGDLRVTRLYYEVVGPANSSNEEIPWVTDMAKTGPVVGHVVKLGAAGVPNTYMDFGTKDPAYTWPPIEFAAIPEPWFDITFARVETWVPGNTAPLCNWRAHEWHHIGVRWTDDQKNHALADPSASMEIYLDGVKAPVADPRQIGPHVTDAIVYDPPLGPAISRPKTPVPNTTPQQYTTEMPRFVRLNQRGTIDTPEKDRRPKDEIQIGGIQRPEAARGGVFKFDTNPWIPANGTVDGVRFYRGNGSADVQSPNRYEDSGVWTNEFDLSDRFDPTGLLELGNLQFTAYLPLSFGKAIAKRNGAGSVVVSFYLVRTNTPGTTSTTANITPGSPGIVGPDAQSIPNWRIEFNDVYLINASNNNNAGSTTIPFPGFNLTDVKGNSVFAKKGDRLVYTVEIYAARLPSATSTTLIGDAAEQGGGGAGGGGGTSGSGGSDGYSVASPALDDISLVYFLPTARVLLKERMMD